MRPLSPREPEPEDPDDRKFWTRWFWLATWVFAFLTVTALCVGADSGAVMYAAAALGNYGVWLYFDAKAKKEE